MAVAGASKSLYAFVLGLQSKQSFRQQSSRALLSSYKAVH